MIYHILAALFGPIHGIARTFLAIAAKIFFCVGVMIAIAAYISGKSMDSFWLYGRWFAWYIAARIAIAAFDVIAVRVRRDRRRSLEASARRR